MAKVDVCDYAIWLKHIHGNDDLKQRLASLRADETVILRVDGQEGPWRKMSDNRTTGQPTPGLSPLGAMRAHWGTVFKEARARGGAVVDLDLVDEDESAMEWAEPSAMEREAAWQAFRALFSAGWRSQGPKLSRDELHERSSR